MTCEDLRTEAVTALNEYLRLHDELTPLLLSFWGTGKPINPHSVEFEHIADLQVKEEAAHKRHRATQTASLEAARRHRD
jgi:hypothetical protein